MTTKTFKVTSGLHKGDKIQFDPRVTHHNSGETYLVGGVVNLGNVLVKRLGDAGIGGVMIPIDELNEVK